jgi:hypothetical protein
MPAVAAVGAIGAVADITEVDTAAALLQPEATGAALSQFEERGVVLLQCVAGAMVMAATGIGVTESVRRRSARLPSALLRQAPTIAAAAATTPTATGFVRATSPYPRGREKS